MPLMFRTGRVGQGDQGCGYNGCIAPETVAAINPRALLGSSLMMTISVTPLTHTGA
jgi:hypothetical protein